MKTLIITLILIILIFLIGCFILPNGKFKEIGSTKYYAKISVDGQINKSINDAHDEYSSYNYKNIVAYTKTEEKSTLNFYTIDGTQFKRGDYIILYVKNKVDVQGYKLITESKIPNNLKNILN